MRNAEATRQRILEAALAEFSAFGIAGARVDRIARTAGCNKNLIYIYFEDKEALFATILRKHVAKVYEDLPFTPDDLPGYAARAFDYAMAHPDVMQLMAWSALEQKGRGPAGRNAAKDISIAELMAAQNTGQVGAAFSPALLLTAVFALATAWTMANPFAASLDAEALKQPADLRRNIAEAVRLLSMS